jgi:hypothetical protein
MVSDPASLPLSAATGQKGAPTSRTRPAFWRDGLFWLALGLTIFAIAPFLQPGYFWGANDARHHVYFLFEYDRLVQDGIWWPRWSPDFAFGYGYPFFNIYGPFSHFLAELFLHFGGLGHTAAVESVFIVSIVASAGAMYLFVRDWAGRSAALIAALVYTYLPYHLLNLYVRANLAESMAFVWLPLCLWCVHMAARRSAYRWVVGAAIAYAGLMLTSNLVVVLFTPLLAIYLLATSFVASAPAAGERVAAGQRLWLWIKRAWLPGLGLLAGLGLSAVFWIPAFMEQRYVRVDQWFAGRYDFRGNFVYPHQLFSPTWGFGISLPGPDDPISFQIGVAALILGVLGVIFAWAHAGRLRWEIGLFAAATVVAVGAALTWAAPLWETPLLGRVLGVAQFPWRWYSVMAPCLSALAGLTAGHWLQEKRQGKAGASSARHWAGGDTEDDAARLTPSLLFLAAVVILASYSYLRVQISEPVEGPVGLASLMRFQQSADEMTGSTAWVKEIPTWSPMADYYIQQEWEGKPVEPVTTRLDYTDFDYETFAAGAVAYNTVTEEVYFLNKRPGEQRLVFNHFYYPGWKAYLLDGEHGEPLHDLPIIPEETGTLGRMTVPVPQGEGYVLLRYEDTPPRTIGGWISVLTVIALCVGGVWIGFQSHHKERASRAAPDVD